MVSQTPGINTDSFIQLIADAKKHIISIYFQPYASAAYLIISHITVSTQQLLWHKSYNID